MDLVQAEAKNLESEQARLLLDATYVFRRNKQYSVKIAEIYKNLFYALVGEISESDLKKISSILAPHHFTPRQITYFLAESSISVAAPILLLSPVLGEIDLITLAGRLPEEHLAVLARRQDLTARMATLLLVKSSRTVREALERNPIVRLEAQRTAGEPNPTVNVPQHTFHQNTRPMAHTALGGLGENQIEHSSNYHQQLINIASKPGQQHSRHFSSTSWSGKRGLNDEFASYIFSNKLEKGREWLSKTTGLSRQVIDRLCYAKDVSSLAIILKALGFKRVVSHQILSRISRTASNNLILVDQAIGVADDMTCGQCADILRKLGGKISVEQPSIHTPVRGFKTDGQKTNPVFGKIVREKRQTA